MCRGLSMIPTVIGSHPDSPWLPDLLRSISPGRPVHVHRGGGYELTALRAGIERFDRFLFLQDSTIVRSPLFWDVIDTAGDTWLFGHPPMYMGVYTSRRLRRALRSAPKAPDKEASIAWEVELAARLPMGTLWPDVTDDTGQIEERHGRTNLRLESDLLTKWKGTWRA